MITIIKEGIWSQFGASIDMLHNAIERCPESKWRTKKKFLFIAYHTIVFLDYYLTFPATNFSPRLPYTITDGWEKVEGAIDDLIPTSDYSQDELLDYLSSCREKCHKFVSALDEVTLKERWVNESGTRNYSMIEILLYNMRHVQHHAAQLNMLLRQEINEAPNWVARATKTHE